MNNGAYTIDEYSLLRALIESSEDRIPICFCIDVSESMEILTNRPEDYTLTNETYTRDGVSQRTVNMKPGKVAHRRIDELKRVLSDMIYRMQSSAIIRDSAIIYIITFSKFADALMGPSTCDSIDSYDIKNIIKIGSDNTNSASGITLALEKLDFISNSVKEAGILSYSPVLVFMSDGSPTDGQNAQNAGKELYKRTQNKELNVIPVAIGDDLDLHWMRSLTNDSKVYKMKFEDEFDEVFKVITKRIVNTTVAMVMDADLVDVECNENGEELEKDKNISSSKYGTEPTQNDVFDFFTAGIQS